MSKRQSITMESYKLSELITLIGDQEVYVVTTEELDPDAYEWEKSYSLNIRDVKAGHRFSALRMERLNDQERRADTRIRHRNLFWRMVHVFFPDRSVTESYP